ncbi:MAG: alanine:cation symporter family protein [Clostridiales bacterium]|nr:alanine:cation symporter family protein [Clostridiales bacterium]
MGAIIGHISNYLYTYVLASLLILIGAGLNTPVLWDVADIFMGLMALINVPVIIYLSRYAFRALKDYIKQKKEGKEPVFKVKDINLPDKVDYWQE